MDANNLDVDMQDIQLQNDETAKPIESLESVETTVKKQRIPRRVLHFSDGVLEEYSTDEDEKKSTKGEGEVKKIDNQLLTTDPRTMYWSSWFWFQVITFGSTTLSACDYLGEKCASFFGITTPKYEYEIDYYNSMKAEEEENAKQQDLEMGGWTQDNRKPATNDLATVKDSDVIATKQNARHNRNWTYV